MKIRHNDIEIDLKDPFQNCKLERKPYALLLTDLLKNYTEDFVLAIDCEWGTGKTTFVKMWRQYLKNEGFKTLYFNAWENDHDNDILVSLISELNEVHDKEDNNAFKSIVKNAVPLVKSLTFGALSTQIEKITGEKFINDFRKYYTLNNEDTIYEQIKARNEKKEYIEKFKFSLLEFLKSASGGNPVIFFIDELDRCRPSYAVDLLEIIKHLFYVKGIVFVLSIDKIQLGNAIKGYYGSDLIDSTEYLRRFIDIEYTLPDPNASTFAKYLYEYYRFDDFFMNENRMKIPDFHYDKSEFLEFATSLFAYKKLTLRVQEKIFSHARLSLTQFKYNNYVLPSLFLLLIYLKYKHKSVYNNVVTKQFIIQDIINQFENIFPENSLNKFTNKYLDTLSKFLICYNNSKEYDLRENLIITDDNSKEKRLAFNSYFHKPNSNEMLISQLDTSIGYYFKIYNFSIAQLTNKIDITEALIIN